MFIERHDNTVNFLQCFSPVVVTLFFVGICSIWVNTEALTATATDFFICCNTNVTVYDYQKKNFKKNFSSMRLNIWVTDTIECTVKSRKSAYLCINTFKVSFSVRFILKNKTGGVLMQFFNFLITKKLSWRLLCLTFQFGTWTILLHITGRVHLRWRFVLGVWSWITILFKLFLRQYVPVY